VCSSDLLVDEFSALAGGRIETETVHRAFSAKASL
jgi:hypothetical protein